MDGYVVLWIPTIVYHDFSQTTGLDPIEKNISDIPGDDLYVKIELESTGNFKIFKKLNDKYDFVVELKREQISFNGLMMLSYQEVSDGNLHFTSTDFPTAIYHMIKSFYHIHDFHDNDSDSSLPPFVTNHKIDIRNNDNEALQHYLKTYSKVISDTANYIQFLIRRVRYNKKEFSFQTRDIIQKLCLYARGYEVYMGVLYHSKYNSICNIDSKDRNWRHCACNIENGLRYIRTIEREHGEYIQQSFIDKVISDAAYSVRMSNRSNRLGFSSIIIGVISLAVALVLAHKSTNELNSVSDTLKQKIDSIPEYFTEINRDLKDLLTERDSLQVIYLEVQKQLQVISDDINCLNKKVQNSILKSDK